MNKLYAVISPDQWMFLEVVAAMLIPISTGLYWLIRGQARVELKVDTMWTWFTNHGSDITGYRKTEEKTKPRGGLPSL